MEDSLEIWGKILLAATLPKRLEVDLILDFESRSCKIDGYLAFRVLFKD